MTDILLPELGEGITDVEISDILVNVGDSIQNDDPIIVLETEKASMEIPTTKTGIIETIHVNKGDVISPGKILISIKTDSSNTENSKSILMEKNKSEHAQQIQTKNVNPTVKSHESEKDSIPLFNSSKLGKPALASPSVRRFARELGCELEKIEGTGIKGRIIQEDVQNYIKNQLTKSKEENSSIPIISPGQNTDFSKWGEIDIQPFNKIKIITGEKLQQAWKAIPHVTQFDKCDITKLEKLRQKLKKINTNPNIKVSLIPFFIKGISILLQEMPQFNSSLDGTNTNLILKKYFNIGVAIDTPNGLVVPVIKNANKKSIKELSKELTSLSNKARNKKLSPSEMNGGCFTISSLGGISGTYFTPIINPPEVAILGISRSSYEPMFIENKLRKRLILPFSLSYDHRVIDGADAARFTKRFSEIISNLDQIT